MKREQKHANDLRNKVRQGKGKIPSSPIEGTEGAGMFVNPDRSDIPMFRTRPIIQRRYRRFLMPGTYRNRQV